MKKTIAAAAVAACLSSGFANAAIVTLTFEGIGDYNPVGNYYNGGGGTNYGIAFSADTLALVDADSGGNGNFANEPSGDTVMFFLNSNNAVMNVAAGFKDGFSFYYTSSTAATINVYDGLNATGNLLGSITVNAQHTNNCGGDPTGTFCNWTPVGVAFAGTAMSVDFGGTANYTGYDNITFGSAVPTIPEPQTYALMLLGLAATASMARRRR